MSMITPRPKEKVGEIRLCLERGEDMPFGWGKNTYLAVDGKEFPVQAIDIRVSATGADSATISFSLHRVIVEVDDGNRDPHVLERFKNWFNLDLEKKNV